MTEAEFMEKFNYAPYELSDIAALLTQVTDNAELVDVASTFLSAKEDLTMELDTIGFEFG